MQQMKLDLLKSYLVVKRITAHCEAQTEYIADLIKTSSTHERKLQYRTFCKAYVAALSNDTSLDVCSIADEVSKKLLEKNIDNIKESSFETLIRCSLEQEFPNVQDYLNSLEAKSKEALYEEFFTLIQSIQKDYWELSMKDYPRLDGSLAPVQTLLMEAAQKIKNEDLGQHYDPDEIAHLTLIRGLEKLYLFKDFRLERFMKWLYTIQKNLIHDQRASFKRKQVDYEPNPERIGEKDSRDPAEQAVKEMLILPYLHCLIAYLVKTSDGLIRAFIFFQRHYGGLKPEQIKSELLENNPVLITFDDLANALKFHLMQTLPMLKDSPAEIGSAFEKITTHLQQVDPDGGQPIGCRLIKDFFDKQPIDAFIQNQCRVDRIEEKLSECVKQNVQIINV